MAAEGGVVVVAAVSGASPACCCSPHKAAMRDSRRAMASAPSRLGELWDVTDGERQGGKGRRGKDGWEDVRRVERVGRVGRDSRMTSVSLWLVELWGRWWWEDREGKGWKGEKFGRLKS